MSLFCLAACSTQSGQDSGWIGPTVAAFIAAVGAIIAAGYTVRAQSQMSQRQERFTQDFTRRQQEIDWRVRQLNELYGPLEMLRATSRLLRKSLPEFEADGKTRWRLVKHIAEAKEKPGQRTIVEGILKISAGVETLLIEKAGLLEGESLPRSFSLFMQHSRLLRMAWDQGGPLVRDGVDVVDVPFPDEVDDDIARAATAVRSALGKARSQA